MVKGDKCWIVENGRIVTLVEVLSTSGSLVLVKTQNDKILRLPKHRLFDTEEKATSQLSKREPKKENKTPYDYM